MEEYQQSLEYQVPFIGVIQDIMNNILVFMLFGKATDEEAAQALCLFSYWQ